jgi:hypothetical protein
MKVGSVFIPLIVILDLTLFFRDHSRVVEKTCSVGMLNKRTYFDGKVIVARNTSDESNSRGLAQFASWGTYLLLEDFPSKFRLPGCARMACKIGHLYALAA